MDVAQGRMPRATTGWEVAVRRVLGSICLGMEVSVVALLIYAAKQVMDAFFVWHAILMSAGVFLFLSHGAVPLF